MRRADLIMAVAMALFSIALMRKSAELPIGWIPDEGPGGGAFPFWLSVGMLLSVFGIVVRGLRRTSALSRSTDLYMDAQARQLFVVGAGSLTVMIASMHLIGIYGAHSFF